MRQRSLFRSTILGAALSTGGVSGSGEAYVYRHLVPAN